jgi:hypothetical protein
MNISTTRINKVNKKGGLRSQGRKKVGRVQYRLAISSSGGFSGVKGAKRRRSKASPATGVPTTELGNEGEKQTNY